MDGVVVQRLGTFVGIALGLLGLVACGIAAGRGYPLHGVNPLPPGENVAQLSGHVRFVDDKDVSKLGNAFELLPGCHLVRTPEKWGRSAGMEGALIVTTGEQLLAIPMKAGHSYVVDVDVPTMTGPDGVARLLVRERDAVGNVTAEFPPVRDSGDLERCERAARDAQR